MFHRMIGMGINCVFALSNIGSSFAQVPEDLNSNPNFLQFPTNPEEVRLQGTQPMTLAQALELARGNNLDLQVALSQVELSRASLREVQADMYPNISLNADLSRTQSSFNQLFGEQSGEQGQLSSTQMSRFGQNEPTTTFSSGLQLEYGLYNFKKGGSSRKAAEEQVLVDELDVERISEDLRLNVTNGYYNLQSADEQVRIYQASVLNYQASLRDALALERSGVGTRFDVLQAQVNLANAQQQLTNAFAKQRIFRRQFAVLLSLPQSVDVSAADPVQLAGLWNQTLEESIVLAFQNRPELQQRLAERTIAQLRQKIELSNLKPKLSFVASYHLEDVFNDRVGVKDFYSIGVKADVNLFDGGRARARASQQSLQMKIAETQFGTQRNTIREQVEESYFNLQSNLLNVQTSSTALSQAQESLRLARLRFQAGVGTQTDVINQEAFLTQAEGNRVTAILNYNRALAQLQRYVTSSGLR